MEDGLDGGDAGVFVGEVDHAVAGGAGGESGEVVAARAEPLLAGGFIEGDDVVIGCGAVDEIVVLGQELGDTACDPLGRAAVAGVVPQGLVDGRQPARGEVLEDEILGDRRGGLEGFTGEELPVDAAGVFLQAV